MYVCNRAHLEDQLHQYAKFHRLTQQKRGKLDQNMTPQARIQPLSKVGVHIRHTITMGVGGMPRGKKNNFW